MAPHPTGTQAAQLLFRGENPPRGALLHFYLKAATEDVRIEIAEVFGAAVHTLRPKGRAGINRIGWDLRFSPSAAEVAAYRQHLLGVVDELVERSAAPHHDALRQLRGRIENGGSGRQLRQLNAARRDLVRDYSVYAGGRSFFGEKLGRRVAAAGDYRVTLFVGGNRAGSAKLTVREDPLRGK